MTIFVCFEGKIPDSKSATGEQYYATLQELLKKQRGFLSETPFLSVDQPGQQVLIAKFTNEASLHNWRKEHTHLQIESKARADVFVDYRIRSGPEILDPETTESESGDGVTESVGKYLLLHQYPTSAANTTAAPDTHSLTSRLSELSLGSLVDAATYQGEMMLKISAWNSKEDAIKVQHATPRIDGDHVHLFQIQRDYGKYNRKEAPDDADAAQAAAVADG